MILLFIYIDYDMQYIYLNSKETIMKLYFKKKTKLNYFLILLSIFYCSIFTAEESFSSKFANNIKIYNFKQKQIKFILDRTNEIINNNETKIDLNNKKYEWFISEYTLAYENDFLKQIINHQIIEHETATESSLYQINFHFSKQSPFGSLFYTIADEKYPDDKNKASRLANKISKAFLKTIITKKNSQKQSQIQL